MLRRTKIILFPALLLICIGLVYVARNGQADATQNSTSLTDGTNAAIIPPKAERAKISNRERLKWLEKNGEVPDDADDIDWQLAEQTSWWGKPIDAKKFWANKVLWMDNATTREARRHGRENPPLPYEDPRIPSYPNDENLYGGGLDSPQHFVTSSKESAFWDLFNKTHPKPPEEIDPEQQTAAASFFLKRNMSIYSEQDLAYVKSAIRNDPVQRHFPQEAFTEEALFWVYAQLQRQEYQRLLDRGEATNGLSLQHFMSQLTIQPKYVIEPVSPEEDQAANAWKVAYLHRLQKEKVDKSYIDAYLQAWNLPATEVFGQSK